MKEYKMTKNDAIGLSLIFSLISVASLSFIVALFFYTNAAMKAWLFFVCFLGVFAIVLRLTITVTSVALQDNNTVLFKKVIGRTTVPVQDIKSIKKYPMRGWFVQTRKEFGLEIHPYVKGIDDFIATVKSINSSIDVKNS